VFLFADGQGGVPPVPSLQRRVEASVTSSAMSFMFEPFSLMTLGALSADRLLAYAAQDEDE
jgi:hypothetical protein